MSIPLYTAANGMQVQQMNMDVIANNLANVNTTGFKQSRPEFQDLLYQNLRPAGANETTSTEIPTGIQIGLGARLAATIRDHSQGSARQTGQELDIMIEGDGYFEIELPDGSSAYTRSGAFTTDSTGRIVTVDGNPLADGVTLPPDRIKAIVGTDGTVSVQLSDGTTTQVGNIQLTDFPNPMGLEAIGHNLFRETETSGAPMTGTPSEDGYGSLTAGFLELSNVDIVDQLVSMIISQRSYEVASKAIQTSDELLEVATQLKR